MSKLLFTLYCIEFYAEHIGKTGMEVYCILKKEKLLNILANDFERLRSIGTEHLMNYIDFHLERNERPKHISSHATVRSLLICDIVKLIARKYKISESEALEMFYSSKTALAFSDEKTGLYSSPAVCIFYLFCMEYERRAISFSNRAYF